MKAADERQPRPWTLRPRAPERGGRRPPALRLADGGKRILLVSTDPASNLDEMLGVALSNRPTPVPGVDRLSALDIDPERAADEYRERVSRELEALGIENQHLAVNAVFEATDRTDRVAAALEERGRRALATLPPRLRKLPTVRIPLRPFDMVGHATLRAMLDDRAAGALSHAVAPPAMPSLPRLSSLIDDDRQTRPGLVMVMGKGGVGKTTIAASVAAELATRGHRVHLSTTDPAAHVATTLDGQVENLTIGRIDPVAETKAYVERAMATRGANLDEEGRALLAEDLRSPCYEEIAVLAAAGSRDPALVQRISAELEQSKPCALGTRGEWRSSRG